METKPKCNSSNHEIACKRIQRYDECFSYSQRFEIIKYHVTFPRFIREDFGHEQRVEKTIFKRCRSHKHKI